MAKISQVGPGRKTNGTIDGITYYNRYGKTFARSAPNMPATIYNTPEARVRQAVFKMVQMHMKHHLRTIRQTISAKDCSPSNRYFSLNYKALSDALQTLAEQYVNGEDVTITDIEAAISAYATEHPTSIRIASLSGYREVYLTGPWPERIVLNALAGDSTVIIIVNENGTQTTINADGSKTIEVYTGETGDDNDNVNANQNDSNETEGTEGDSGLTPNPSPEGEDGLTPSPSPEGEGSSFTIKAAVTGEGGTVTIKKNGEAVEGGSVQATGSDTVVIEAVPESDNFQFMGWSDGVNANPRTIQPSTDMNVSANFLDLSRV